MGGTLTLRERESEGKEGEKGKTLPLFLLLSSSEDVACVRNQSRKPVRETSRPTVQPLPRWFFKNHDSDFFYFFFYIFSRIRPRHLSLAG